VEYEITVEVAVEGPLWWRVRGLNRQGQPLPWSSVGKVEVELPPLATSVRGMALNPTSVAGGGSVDAVVTLDEPAPVGGAMVTLWADSDQVKVPPRVLFSSLSSLL
jgi:hypothetical protein